MAFLFWLQETDLARYVKEGPWGYPIVLSCHAVGMALLAGVVLMIDFRVLGFGPAVPLQYLRRLNKLAFAGLVLNLISGLMLFVADAVSHFTAFRIGFMDIPRVRAKPVCWNNDIRESVPPLEWISITLV